ncbi:MAG: biopolymer transporter ExbD [Verrucomicrobia bacterium]|nr:biopolymer transporter ExbD [Verrucomicrobiota bacterium]
MTIPSPRSRKKARIEIIPLIDIVFFLLATFVMVSLSMVKMQSVPVNLPVASTSVPQDRQDYAAITIAEDGSLFFNKESVSPDQLIAKLRKFKEENLDPKIFINGDEKSYLGHAIAVLDDVRKLGISKVAIETRPKSSAAP